MHVILVTLTESSGSLQLSLIFFLQRTVNLICGSCHLNYGKKNNMITQLGATRKHVKHQSISLGALDLKRRCRHVCIFIITGSL